MSVKSTDCTLESLPFEISEPEEKSDSKSTIGGAGGQSSAAGGGQEAAAAGGREKVLTEAELNSLAAKIVKVFFHCSATSKEYFVRPYVRPLRCDSWPDERRAYLFSKQLFSYASA